MRTFGLSATAGLALLVSLAGCQGGLERGLLGPIPATSEELILELEEEKTRIDTITDQMVERIDAYNASRAPGEREVNFGELFYSDLNEDQRDVLDMFLEEEKRPTYRNLLQRIIEDRNNLEEAQERIQYLEQKLPDDFVIAKAGDEHLPLAYDFLEKEGIDDNLARILVSEISLYDELLPGFKIWFNYDQDDGSFKTYVTRGEAGRTPIAVARAKKRQLVNERDAAVAKSVVLEQTKVTLARDIEAMREDLMKLEDRRSTLDVQVADLEARNAGLEAKRQKLTEDLGFTENTLFYHAASEQALAEQGILTRFLKNLKDVKGISYDEALDLRQANSISFTSEAYGLKQIEAVDLWPGIYQEGRDYSISVDPSGQSATVVFNDANMFKKQKVLIALRGKS